MSKKKGGHARGQYTLAARLSLSQDTVLVAPWDWWHSAKASP